MTEQHFEASEFSGKMRLDKFLAARLPELSRSRIQALIEEKHVLLNGGEAKASSAVRLGDKVKVTIPEVVASSHEAEEIPLKILFEDRDLVVINKPSGLVVHPGAGNPAHTLVNALLHHVPDLSGIGGEERPGIVHRLDKDTSGCIVVAKNDLAHRALAAQFAGRSIQKVYLALVHGKPAKPQGRIETLIGRHPVHRKKMAVVATPDGRNAITEYQILGVQGGYCLVSCRLLTGRTHQIRVHLKHLGHPLAGDVLYGGKLSNQIQRQMLHAWQLGFTHPTSGDWRKFEAPLPEDFLPFAGLLPDLS